jgi:conjugative relaxase-like TrwC/TraI family protein
MADRCGSRVLALGWCVVCLDESGLFIPYSLTLVQCINIVRTFYAKRRSRIMISLAVVNNASYFHSMNSEHAVEYLSENEKVKGFWQGKLAEKEGLVGKEVKQNDVERIASMIKNGERVGLNITYSAPKSVSIAFAILGDQRIKEAHEQAVRTANEWVEKNLVETRQGQCGRERVKASGVAIANYTHEISRSHDPQLHTHSVILNAVERVTDGQIRALEPKKIFEYQKAIDQVYKNELASRLQELGYSVEMKDKNGNFEIKGITQDVIDKFSERSRQIENTVEKIKNEISTDNQYKLRDIAAIESRDKKEFLSQDELNEKWNRKLSEIAVSKETVKQSIESAKTESRNISEDDVKKCVKEACSVIHANESAFSQEKLTEIALRLSMSQAGTGKKVITQRDVERAVQDLQKEGYIKKLESGYMTTKEMQRIEREVISYISRTNGAANAVETDREKIDQAIKEFERKAGYDMTDDQRQAVHHILESRDMVIGIQGDAGTGKTTVFSLIRQEMEKRGYTVRGITPTGKAADVMSRETGIKTETVDSFLIHFSGMKIVDNRSDYVRQYEKLNQKFESKDWTAPESFSGGKTETWQSQIESFLRDGFGIGKKEERISWFEIRTGEHCYRIERDDFQGKMIVEHVKTEFGRYETHVWIKNERTGDLAFTSYADAGFGCTIKERSEKWANPLRTIEKGREVWIVDETSMMGSKEVKQLLDAAKQADARVVFCGDTKQLASVEAGQIFKDMQENGMSTIRMTEKVRQKDIEYKKTVDALARKDWDTVREKMETYGGIREIQNRGERITEIKKDFLAGDPGKTLVVTTTNRDKNELNTEIRNELKNQGRLSDGYKFTVRESKNLSSEEKRYAFSYSVGDIVFANRKDLRAMGISTRTNELTVSSVDIAKNIITLRNANGKEYTVNVKDHGDKFSVYSSKEIEISKGDRLITLKNDKAVGVRNGEIWQVKNIDKNGNMTIKNSDKEKTINILDYNYMDHAYAVTTYKSQGMTVSKVISDVSSERTNYNEVYTAMTRGKMEYRIYTDNKDKFYDEMRNVQGKTSTLGESRGREGGGSGGRSR